MPYPNEHSARLTNPNKYKRFARKNDEFGKGIDAIYGITDDGKAELQAIRFDKDKFTPAEAKKWLDENNYDKYEFEKAEIKESLSFHQALEPTIAESPEPKGIKWLVTILKVGQSLAPAPQDFYFTEEALKSAPAVFEGASVYAHQNGMHVDNRNTHDKIGWLDNVYYDSVEQSLKAFLNLLPSADWLRKNLLYAYEQKQSIYELSIDAGGIAEVINGRKEVKYFKGVNSVDVVDKGAAGGKFEKLIQSLNKNKEVVMKEKLVALFKKFFPNVEIAQDLDEGGIIALIDKNLETLAEETKAKLEQALKPIKEQIGKDKELEELQKAIKEMKAQMSLSRTNSLIESSNLPVPIQQILKKQFENLVVEEKVVQEVIAGHREAYAKLVQALPKTFISMGLEQKDKIALGLDGLFLEKSRKPLTPDERKTILKDVPPIRSIKQAYIMLTGDELVSGYVQSDRITQSIATTDWTNVLANAVNKRLVRDYIDLNLDTWKAFADIVPISDFKQQSRVRYGGYANAPIVPEGAAYTGATSPTDEKATYTPFKIGYTEDLTREMIKNDDVGAVQRIPSKLARSIAQTLHEFVYELINPATNGTIYDDVVLYHLASHANYATTALSSDSLSAARLRMKKQTMKDNSKRIGIRTGFLLVPSDLEKTAWELCTPKYGVYNEIPTFLQQVGVIPITVDYWTDVTNWALVAKKEDCVGLEIGFMDGKELPELFISDLPNIGSMFTNDKLTFKIRHEYGGAIIDYRAFDGSVVAG